MEKLIQYFEENKIEYREDMVEKFQKYMEEVLKWNESVNLTAIKEKPEFVLKHFVDSVTAATLPEIKEAKKILDMGTGAGFPGVPLAILFEDKEFLLVDSLKKRLNIIEEICKEIGIKNVKTLHMRAEDMGQNLEYRESFDIVTSRAVANLATLSEYCLPLVKVGGHMLSYKGAGAEEELEKSSKSIKTLGGSLKRVETFNLAEDAEEHKIIVLEKISSTSKKYPRKAGMPSKAPIR